MARTYEEAGSREIELLASVVRSHHGELADASVKVQLLKVYKRAGGEMQPADLKHGGYPAIAIVKINSLKDRVEGKADATILLDGYQWDHEMSEDQRRAVLDHEVMHLMLERDGEGQIVADDIGRPKLKMRLHDFHFGGFHAIAERHGPHAVEHAAVKSLGEAGWVQGVLQWG